MKSPLILTSIISIIAALHFPVGKRKNITQKRTLFDPQQTIYRSKYNITSILTPVDGVKQLNKDAIDIPLVFFTITDPKYKGGSSILVLENFEAYEVLEGGRDSTSDYGPNKDIYFGASDGIYKFIPEALTARRFGTVDDDILQIQKALNGDIVIRNADDKLFRVTRNGTVKKKVSSIYCVKQFVLDTSDNIYYLGCKNNSLHIIPVFGRKMSIPHMFDDVLLIRPPFNLNNCIPILGDKKLYMLSVNGSLINTELVLEDKPSAISVDAALYFVAALKGGIYELNVMELVLKSVFKIAKGGQANMSKVLISIMLPSLEGYKGYDVF